MQILIVDDEPSIRKTLRIALTTSLASCEVLEAADRESALRHGAESNPELSGSGPDSKVSFHP